MIYLELISNSKKFVELNKCGNLCKDGCVNEIRHGPITIKKKHIKDFYEE